MGLNSFSLQLIALGLTNSKLLVRETLRHNKVNFEFVRRGSTNYS